MGRRQWQPTPEQIEEIKKYANEGVPHEIIANILGIAPRTLSKHCGDILEQCASKVKAEFMGALYKLGVKDLVPSAVYFYLKTRCGYRETDRPAESEQPPTKMIFNRGPDRVSQVIEQETKIKKAS